MGVVDSVMVGHVSGDGDGRPLALGSI